MVCVGAIFASPKDKHGLLRPSGLQTKKIEMKIKKFWGGPEIHERISMKYIICSYAYIFVSIVFNGFFADEQ